MGLTAKLSDSLGVDESGLRFILSMISGVVSKDSKIQLSVSNYIINIFSIVIFFVSGYPLFLFHRHYLRKTPPVIQHAFFALSGMLISYWSIGLDCVLHSSTCILVSSYWSIVFFLHYFMSKFLSRLHGAQWTFLKAQLIPQLLCIFFK